MTRRAGPPRGDQLIASRFLHDLARIEGLMACRAIALVVHALVELDALGVRVVCYR